jgi:sugar lactone lactonase YvrE
MLGSNPKKLAAALSLMMLLAGCGGGGSSNSPSTVPVPPTPPVAPTVLSGVAATGAPIVGATINVICATGSALSATTSNTGTWQATLSNQTLPCGVEATGGTVNGAPNTNVYTSIAMVPGTVNVSPLTAMLVDYLIRNQNIGDFDTWFAGLQANPASLAAITNGQITTALGSSSAALPQLPALAANNPITTTFTATPGNISDDMLVALNVASVSVSNSYVDVLIPGNLSPNFAAALTTAWADTASGGNNGTPEVALTVTINGVNGSLILGNNGDSLNVTANGTATFPIKLINGSAYSISVATPPTGQLCTITGGTGKVTGTLSNAVITCATGSGTLVNYGEVWISTTPMTYAQAAAQCALPIGGQTGWWLAADNDVSDFFSGPNPSTPLNRYFWTSSPAGAGNHVAAEATPAYPFGADGASKDFPDTDSTDVYGICFSANIRASYTFSGTVTGMVGSLVLTTGYETLTVSANGNFTFPTIQVTGTPYTLSILDQPSSQNCTLANGTGTSTTEAVSNLAITCVTTPPSSASGTISTIAGSGTQGYLGDNGPAINAEIYNAASVATDNFGNIYFADSANSRIRKVAASTGIISTVAGNGTSAFSGDGGPATSASLYSPTGVAIDANGNLYIADTENSRIRKVNAATGIISTVAGTGTTGFSGDNGIATSATLSSPCGLAVDAAGNLYFADIYNVRVRKVAASTGIITTVAGNGTAGVAANGVPATTTMLWSPQSVAVDFSGNVYIADGANVIYRVGTDGLIMVAAGTESIDYIGPNTFSGDNGPAINATISVPHQIAVDAGGNVYFADNGNDRIRKITATTGIISTVAGNGNAGYSGDNGPATAAAIGGARGVAVDASGNLYIADGNSRIRKVLH